MMLPYSSNEFTTDNYSVAQWLTMNADDIRPTMAEMFKALASIQGGLLGYAMVKTTVLNNLKRIIHQESGLNLRIDEVLILMEDAGVQKIVDLYFTDPIMREINNETN